MNDHPVETPIGPPAYRSQYARLARRIAGATSNLVATGVVLALALGAGRELISWWGLNPEHGEAAPSLAEFDWVEPDPSCLLEFGDAPYSLQRDVVAGDVQDALAHLRRLCRQALSHGAKAIGEPGPAEVQLLDSAQHWKPVEEQPGVWRMFQSEEQIPLVFVLRDAPAPSRLAVWGLAIPQGEGEWTTYLCRAADPAAATDIASPPLPPGGRRTMKVADPRGGALIGFRGGTPMDAIEHFDAWTAENSWRTIEAWRHEGGVWRARLAPAGGSSGVTIQLAMDDKQTLRGLMVIEPPTASGGALP